MNKVSHEILVMVIVLVVSFFIFSEFDLLEKIVKWSKYYEQYEIDEIFSCSIVLVVLLMIFSVRRWLELKRQSDKLQTAINEIKTLRGIIPICSFCNKIRDDKGAWEKLEWYVQTHSYAEFSHGICPECYQKQIDQLSQLD